jgi:hypothetical protein
VRQARHQAQADHYNGMVEGVHRQIKDALRSKECGQQWTAHLHWVLMGLWAAPKEESATSSAEPVYSCPQTLPRQFQPDKEQVVDSEAVRRPTPPDQWPTRKLSNAEMTGAEPAGL